MSATAIAILHWNLIPVFVDIQESNFCIDPKLVEAAISSRTRAILSVDIFGNSADIESLSSIAKRHNLILISDSAQSPGAKYDGKYAGTFGDIGGLSLNYHKHIHTGEGGVLFTNDDNLALRMQMIRNHAESASDGAGLQNTPNMIGFNFRLGEIEAAMGIEQLKKLKSIVEMKQKVANCLSHTLRNLQGLITPKIQEQNEHVYYVFPLILDKKLVHISRAEIVSALRAEGVPALSEGYQNLHMLSVFQNKSVYHNSKLPWSLNSNSQFISYEQGTFPISERLHNETFIGFGITGIDVNEEDVKLIGNAFHKVWHGLKLI
jgi:dTDP-4-amino-4,6-dideoxygalactose transaminase